MKLHAALVALLFHSGFDGVAVYSLPSKTRALRSKSSKQRSKSVSFKSRDLLKRTKSDYEECQHVTKCVKSFHALKNAIVKASPGDYIGICRDIYVNSTPIRVDKSDITLVGCCSEPHKCVIGGAAVVPNLVVTGGDFSLLNVIVQGGRCDSANQQGGGNLQFRSNTAGSLTIVDSEFRNGICNIIGGGNVDVSTAGSVTFRRSIFKDGKSTLNYSGGGAFVTESPDITVDDCVFDGNKEIGFVLYSGSGDGFFKAVIKDSVFTNNEGGVAGGIFYSDFGSLQRLEVLRTEFTSNTATDDDGAGAAFISQNIESNPSTFLWKGNFGSGNSGMCPEVLFWVRDDCFSLDETYIPS